MAKLTQTGNFKSRVEFVKTEHIKGEWGTEESEITVGSFYCELRSQNLTEVRANIGNEVLEDTLTLIIRHYPGTVITTDMEAIVDNVRYEVVKHTPDVARKQFDTVILKARA